MSSTATIVCLANSRKLGGRCVAGILWDGKALGKWVRPISTAAHGELFSERIVDGSKEPNLLDLIKIGLKEPRPIGCHVEDVIVDSGFHWTKVGRFNFDNLAPFASSPVGPLWANAGSTNHGENDSIPSAIAEKLSSSLTLIRPKELILTSTQEGRDRSKKKVRGTFRFGSFTYTLSVTDPRIEMEFKSSDEGDSREVRKPLVCISIGEVFEAQNACYKLIAGVIEEV